MACTDLDEMIEGDLMYTDQLNLLPDEIILAPDYESINHNDSNHSHSIVLDDTTDDDEIKIISCKIKTAQEYASDDDDIHIVATNIIKNQEWLTSVDKSPLPSDHINESQNNFIEDPYNSVGDVSTSYSLDKNSLSSNNTNKSQNDFKEDPYHSVENVSTSNSSDKNPSSSNNTNESQNNFKEDPYDSVGDVITSYNLDSRRFSSNYSNESQNSSKVLGLKNISTVHKKTLPKELKKRFVSKDLIDLYCVSCNKTNKIFRRSKISKCKSCKTLFKYQCIQCKSIYKTFQKAFLHVKFQCELAKNHLASFHCSACYYDTRNQANLKNHILNHHAIKKCIDCNEERENGQMAKHKIFECKVPGYDHINGEIKTPSENVRKKRGRKSKYVADSVFLTKYCKSCEATKDASAYGDYSYCKDCNTVFQHQCVTCCKRFQKLATAKIHIRSCNYPPRFQCSECNYQTAYRANFIAHLDSKHIQKECEVCLTVCDSKLSLRNHEKYECKRHPRYQGVKLLNTPKRRKITKAVPQCYLSILDYFVQPFCDERDTFNLLKLYCSRCKEGYERTSSILSSCKKCNNQVKLQCVKCLALFNHFSTGYKHVKRVCIMKNKKVNVKKEVRENNLKTRNTYKHKICPECHRNNFTPESLDAHLEQCKSRPSFQCSSCIFSTKSKKNLRRHYKNKHEHAQKYISCPTCHIKLRYSSLKNHRQFYCRVATNTNIDKTKVHMHEIAHAHFENVKIEYVDCLPKNVQVISNKDIQKVDVASQSAHVEE